MAVSFTDGYPAAVPLAREAVGRSPDQDRARIRATCAGCGWHRVTAVDLWDDEHWDVLTARHVRIARELGDLTELPLVLNSRLILHLFAGEISGGCLAGRRDPDDLRRDRESAWRRTARSPGRPGVAGLDEATPLIAATTDEVTARGEGGGMSIAHWANAVLMNGLARYQEALAAAQAATADPTELGVASWALPELIESAVRSGRPRAGGRRLRPAERADAGQRHRLGARRARSIERPAGDGRAAESGYQEAIERLGRTRIRMDLARAHLLYGEWLRREGRRQDARVQLRTAYDMFSAAGADAFADRATPRTRGHR